MQSDFQNYDSTISAGITKASILQYLVKCEHACYHIIKKETSSLVPRLKRMLR